MKAAKEEIERQLSVARQREGQLSTELSKLKESATQRQTELDKLAAEAAEAAKLREENEQLNSQVISCYLKFILELQSVPFNVAKISFKIR